jgi:hypothetical protein
LFDEDRRVLLVRFSYHGRIWGAAPGDGLEDEETHGEGKDFGFRAFMARL